MLVKLRRPVQSLESPSEICHQREGSSALPWSLDFKILSRVDFDHCEWGNHRPSDPMTDAKCGPLARVVTNMVTAGIYWSRELYIQQKDTWA